MPHLHSRTALTGECGPVCPDLTIIRAVVTRRRLGIHDPEDIAQEAWVAILSLRHRFREGTAGGGFAAWSAVVVKHRLANLARRPSSYLSPPIPTATLDSLPGRESDPLEEFERTTICSSLHEAIDEAREHLPSLSHNIIRLRWIEGHSVTAIAEMLGISADRVRDRHRRAWPIFRRLIERRLGPVFSHLPVVGKEIR